MVDYGPGSLDAMKIEYKLCSLSGILEKHREGFVTKDKKPVKHFGKTVIDAAQDVVVFECFIDEPQDKRPG